MATVAGKAKIKRAEVNRAASQDSGAFMAECHLNYEKQVADFVRRIAEDGGERKLIMLSGPSASGKTTTSLKIKQGLEARGICAVSVSIDDFFKPREMAPLLPDGSRDFESLGAVDLELLHSVLKSLIEEGEAELPHFEFRQACRSRSMTHTELPEGGVAVLEGLHALNSAVIDRVPVKNVHRLYVSVSSDFIGEDGSTALTSRAVRLIRRTIRDYHFRGSSTENTLDMWDTVCRGEDLYVRPFKSEADVAINSVFACEPCLFSAPAIKLLNMVPQGSRHFELAQKLISGLSAFDRMPLEIIPRNCMLREFVGGSEYYNKSGRTREV